MTRLLTAAVVLAIALPVLGQPAVHTLTFDKQVMGPTFKKVEDLKGKLVLFEEFGLNCGPCMAMMPHLVQWHNEYADFGLVIICVHRQDATAEVLRERCKALGIRFSVYETGNIPGSKGMGIPNCALFLPNGEVAYDGHPKNVEVKLRSAIGATIASEVSNPTKSMEPVVEMLKKGVPPMDVMKKLTNLKNAEKATADQAKLLIERLTAGSRKRLEGLPAAAKDDPVAAYEDAVILATRWKGYEIGTKAQELASKWKTSAPVVAELKARPSLDAIKKLDATIFANSKGDDFTSPEFKKKFSTQLKELRKLYDAMKRQYPDARSTKEAFEVVEKYELTK